MKQLSDTVSVIEALGGPTAVSKLLSEIGYGDFTPQRVSNWKRSPHFPPATYFPLHGALKTAGFDASPELWGLIPPSGDREGATRAGTPVGIGLGKPSLAGKGRRALAMVGAQ